MGNEPIALIIPAYKSTYLDQTLNSIVKQTDKNFNVYIGNDGGDTEITDIIKKYESFISIKYKYFKNNIGKTDLIKSWGRTFNLIENEKYFIFFSDDDILEENAIEELHKNIRNYPNINVFHFNLKIIDNNNQIIKIKEKGKYPKFLSAWNFYELLLKREITARMPDFAFKTETFKNNGGFVNYPLAMYSDNATTIINSLNNGILQLKSSVFWRTSDVNISSNIGLNKEKCFNYIISTNMYYIWIKTIFGKTNLSLYQQLKKI